MVLIKFCDYERSSKVFAPFIPIIAPMLAVLSSMVLMANIIIMTDIIKTMAINAFIVKQADGGEAIADIC
jgi:Na+/alanine symporter